MNKKKRPETLIAVLFIAMILGAFLLPIEKYQQYLIMAVLIALFLFLRRSSLYFIAGAGKIQKHPESEKVWKNFRKAIATGLDAERSVMVLTAFIQQNDANYAVEQLEKLIEKNASAKNPDQDIDRQARIALSMAYWTVGQKDKAVDSALEMFNAGWSDNNLMVNLGSFLLTLDRVREAGEVVARCGNLAGETNGMLDNRGWYNILTGNIDAAKSVYCTLINENGAKFPEAYVHAAQLALRDGKPEMAADCLQNALTKIFIRTCEFTKDYVTVLAKGISNPATAEAFAAAMIENEAAVSRGQDFPGMELADASFEIPAAKAFTLGFTRPEQPQAELSAEGEEPKQVAVDDDEDRVPNTDVGDDDDNWSSPEV